jgi:hypothetical protein
MNTMQISFLLQQKQLRLLPQHKLGALPPEPPFPLDIVGVTRHEASVPTMIPVSLLILFLILYGGHWINIECVLHCAAGGERAWLQLDYVAGRGGGGRGYLTLCIVRQWTESFTINLLTASHPSLNNKQWSYCEQCSVELRVIEWFTWGRLNNWIWSSIMRSSHGANANKGSSVRVSSSTLHYSPNRIGRREKRFGRPTWKEETV